jgi:hypothetical protein
MADSRPFTAWREGPGVSRERLAAGTVDADGWLTVTEILPPFRLPPPPGQPGALSMAELERSAEAAARSGWLITVEVEE